MIWQAPSEEELQDLTGVLQTFHCIVCNYKALARPEDRIYESLSSWLVPRTAAFYLFLRMSLGSRLAVLPFDPALEAQT